MAVDHLIFNKLKWWAIESINGNVTFNSKGKPVFNMTRPWVRVTTGQCPRASYLLDGSQSNFYEKFSDWGTYAPSRGYFIGRVTVNFSDIGKTELIAFRNDNDDDNSLTFVRASDATVWQNGGVTALYRLCSKLCTTFRRVVLA